ncbi:hypothetical protein A2U01_0116403, partial [Trifolium medium]|nr:hypothetical protein [Trifolium medium]
PGRSACFPFLVVGETLSSRGGVRSRFLFGVEAVPEQDASSGCCHGEEEVSRTCGVSAGENENCFFEG